MLASVSAIEEAAAPNTPAAVRTIPSIRLRRAAGPSTESVSDPPTRSGWEWPPRARAKAATEATRRSGIISRPACTASAISGGTSGASSRSLVGLAYTGGLPTISVHSVAARLKTSLRGETEPPANTSGAM